MDEVEPVASPQPVPAFRRPLARPAAMTVVAGATVAAVLSVIGVIRADSDGEGAGVGSGFLFATLFAAGVCACALAMLARRRLELISFAGVVVALAAIDLLALAIAAQISASGYARAVAVFFTWAVIALLVLGLALAAPIHGLPSRLAFAVTASALVISGIVISAEIIAAGGDGGFDPFGLGLGTGGVELRLLGVTLTIGASGWLVTLATSRLDRS